MTASGDRLIAEALAKSGVIWLTSTMGSGPVWYATLHDVAYVVTGPGEQSSPAHHGPTQVITRSKETRARLLSYEADVETLQPEDDDWDAAVAALIAGRLNAPTGDTEARWREHNTILRLRPDTSSVVIRGEHVTAHERQVEAGPAEPDITPENDTSDVTPTASSSAVPSVAQPVTPAKNTPESHTSENSAKEQSAPSPRAAETQPIPVRPRKTVPTPTAAPIREESPKINSSTTADIVPGSKPVKETTQPIPARTPRRTEQTQPIPVQPSTHRSRPPAREITEPIPVRSRNRGSADAVPVETGDVETPNNATKVDQ